MSVALLRGGSGRATIKQIRLLASLARHGLSPVTSLSVTAFRSDGGNVSTASRCPDFVAMMELNDPNAVKADHRIFKQGLVDHVIQPLTHNQLCFRLLKSLGERGIIVNYAPKLCALGDKSILERRCREIEQDTATKIPRPDTWLYDCDGSDNLQRPCPELRIIKPANKSRAEGISLIRKHETIAESLYPCVAQELLENPLLVGGHKIDARAYVFIWNKPRFGFSLSHYVRIRHAGIAYRRGEPLAEICSTSACKRAGISGKVSSLAEVELPASEIIAIREQIAYTVSQTMCLAVRITPDYPLFTVWGLDLALCLKDRQATAMLLEVNPFPQFFNGDGCADAQIDDILMAEMAQHLSAMVHHCKPVDGL